MVLTFCDLKSRVTTLMVLVIALTVLQMFATIYLGVSFLSQGEVYIYLAVFLPSLFSVKPSADRMWKLSYNSGDRVWFFLSLTVMVIFWLHILNQDTRYYYNDPGDQRAYYEMLIQILARNFSTENFYYGLGYPLLAVFAAEISPANPLQFVNMLCLGASVFFLGKLLEKFCSSFMAAFFLIIALVLNPFFIQETIRPWSTTPVLALYAASLYASISFEKMGSRFLLLGFAIGWIFATRYLDVLLLAPLWVFYLLKICRQKVKSEVVYFVVGSSIGFIITAGVLYSHYHYFGSIFTTPYSHHHQLDGTTDESLVSYFNHLGIPMLVNVYGSLVDPRTTSWSWGFGPNSPGVIPVFARFIAFYLSPIGLYLIYKNRVLPLQLMRSIIAGITLFLLVYSTHPGAYPGHLRFGSGHYFKTLFPVFLAGTGYMTACIMRNELSWQRLAKLIFGLFSVYTLFSVLATFVTPVAFHLEAQHNSIRPGETVELTVRLTNRYGKPPMANAISAMHPVAFLKEVSSDANDSVKKVIQMTRDPHEAAIWRGSYTISEDPKVTRVSLWTYRSSTLNFSRLGNRELEGYQFSSSVDKAQW
jgi:hypothetical protein